jgi:PhnB protein
VNRPHALTPHLFVKDVIAAISFYRKAFGAVELFRNVLPNGVILLVELAVGGGRLLVSEETPGLNALAPPTVGGTPMLLMLEVDDVDDLFRRAVFAGAEVELPVAEMFFGERYAVVVDPFGHRWSLSTRREQLTPDDILRNTPPEVDA